jgi:aliphatic sulfonates family ABC transporter substrate-binding protein
MTLTFNSTSRPDRRYLLSLAGGAAVAACAPPAAAATIRIGYQKNGVLLLAKSRGVVANVLRPIKLKWVEFPSGPPLLEALNAGAVDLGATGDAPPIFAQAAGAPLKYAAVQPISGDGEAVIVPPASSLRTAADLRGKRVAFTKASSSHLLVVKALAQAGLKLSDVQPIYLTPSDAASAFARNAVDAWATWDPYLALAQRDQKARVLVSGAALPKSDAFYLASRHFIDTAPTALAVLLEALRHEAVWGQAHRPEVVRIVAAASGLPPDIVEASLRRGALAVDPMTPDVVARQQASADIFQSIGAIPAHVSVADAAWTGWRPRS